MSHVPPGGVITNTYCTSWENNLIHCKSFQSFSSVQCVTMYILLSVVMTGMTKLYQSK